MSLEVFVISFFASLVAGVVLLVLNRDRRANLLYISIGLVLVLLISVFWRYYYNKDPYGICGDWFVAWQLSASGYDEEYMVQDVPISRGGFFSILFTDSYKIGGLALENTLPDEHRWVAYGTGSKNNYFFGRYHHPVKKDLTKGVYFLKINDDHNTMVGAYLGQNVFSSYTYGHLVVATDREITLKLLKELMESDNFQSPPDYLIPTME